MDRSKMAGTLFLILGLIFIIFPMFSAESVSFIVGVSLFFFGFASLINGISGRSNFSRFSTVNLILGIISIIFGVLFIFAFNALSFLAGLQFYIIGFIMILFGITGIIGDSKVSKTTSFLILAIGIIAIVLAVSAMAKPVYAAILIGICLIIHGLRFAIE